MPRRARPTVPHLPIPSSAGEGARQGIRECPRPVWVLAKSCQRLSLVSRILRVGERGGPSIAAANKSRVSGVRVNRVLRRRGGEYRGGTGDRWGSQALRSTRPTRWYSIIIHWKAKNTVSETHPCDGLGEVGPATDSLNRSTGNVSTSSQESAASPFEVVGPAMYSPNSFYRELQIKRLLPLPLLLIHGAPSDIV